MYTKGMLKEGVERFLLRCHRHHFLDAVIFQNTDGVLPGDRKWVADCSMDYQIDNCVLMSNSMLVDNCVDKRR